MLKNILVEWTELDMSSFFIHLSHIWLVQEDIAIQCHAVGHGCHKKMSDEGKFRGRGYPASTKADML